MVLSTTQILEHPFPASVTGQLSSSEREPKYHICSLSIPILCMCIDIELYVLHHNVDMPTKRGQNFF